MFGCGAPTPLRGGRINWLVGVIASLAEVLWFDVADVQKAVAPHAEVDEGRLDARLQVDDYPLVDVPNVIILAGSLDIQFFEHAIFDDRNPAFLRLRYVDQHLLFHAYPFFSIRNHVSNTLTATVIRYDGQMHLCVELDARAYQMRSLLPSIKKALQRSLAS